MDQPSKFPFTDAPFGFTSPVKRCAEKHGVDYTDALYIADFYLHRRDLPAIIVQTYNAPHFAMFRKDLESIAEYWYPAFHGHAMR